MATKKELEATVLAVEEAVIEIMTGLAERVCHLDLPDIHELVENALEDMQSRLGELTAGISPPV